MTAAMAMHLGARVIVADDRIRIPVDEPLERTIHILPRALIAGRHPLDEGTA